MKLVYENLASTSEKNSLNLLAVFRDEEILLPYFVDYYQSLGVTDFYFIDNMSKDQGSDYLKSRKDINLKLFYTDASYSDSYYGTAWQNQCMDKFCTNQYCLRVDIDELFQIHPQYPDLQALIRDMEHQGNNVLPALMLDMYPKTLNNDYQAGMPFPSHSPYFDRFNAKHLHVRSGLYKNFYWIEGGFRSRFFNTSNILQKFPLVKNTFFNTNLYMTPHFFYKAKKALLNAPGINLHQPHALLLHYKFLKPDITNYLSEQLKNNQHWNNSEEYRKYYAVLKEHHQIDFYHPHYSRQYQNPSSPQAFWNLHDFIHLPAPGNQESPE